MSVQNLSNKSDLRSSLVTQFKGSSVTLQWLIEAGSSAENAGENGLADQVREAVFDQKGNKPKSIVEVLEQDLGAIVETSTSRDYTGLSVIVLKENLEEALQALALSFEPLEEGQLKLSSSKDRLDFFANHLAFDSGLRAAWIKELIFRSVFRVHPYRWSSTILSNENNDGSKLVAFHREHYVFKKTVLSVVGPIDSILLSELTDKIFVGNKVKRDQVISTAGPQTEPIQRGHRSSSVDLDINYPAVGVAFQAVEAKSPLFEAFIVLAEILGSRTQSRLQNELMVKRNWTSSVSAEIKMMKDVAPFIITAEVFSKEILQAVQERIYSELFKLRSSGPSEDEVEGAKLSVLRRYFFNSAQPKILALNMALHELTGRGTLKMNTFSTDIMSVTSGQIKEISENYLMPDQRSIVVFNPKTGTH